MKKSNRNVLIILFSCIVFCIIKYIQISNEMDDDRQNDWPIYNQEINSSIDLIYNRYLKLEVEEVYEKHPDGRRGCFLIKTLLLNKYESNSKKIDSCYYFWRNKDNLYLSFDYGGYVRDGNGTLVIKKGDMIIKDSASIVFKIYTPQFKLKTYFEYLQRDKYKL